MEVAEPSPELNANIDDNVHQMQDKRQRRIGEPSWRRSVLEDLGLNSYDITVLYLEVGV